MMKNLFAFIQAAALIILITALSMVEAVAQQTPIDETRDVAANEKIRIEVMRGDVTITTNTDNRFTVRGLLDEDAEGFELESSRGFTDFRVQMPRRINGSWNSDGSELAISVPVNSDIEFTGVNVEVNIDGVQGGSRIRTVNGPIDARNLANFVELDTVNGEIISIDNQGRVSITTVNGEIEERNTVGRLAAQAVNGQIDTDSQAEIVALNVVNGEIRGRLQGVLELEIETVNGSIELQLPDTRTPRVSGSSVSGAMVLGFDADVDARFTLRNSVGGSIRNGLTDDEPERGGFGPSRRLEFTTGAGEGDVTLTSLSGRLEVRQQ